MKRRGEGGKGEESAISGLEKRKKGEAPAHIISVEQKRKGGGKSHFFDLGREGGGSRT